MKAGYSGTFVMAWSQTEVDGLCATGLSDVAIGSTWRWSGAATRIDGAEDLLVLQDPVAGARAMPGAVARRLGRLIADLSFDRRPETAAGARAAGTEPPLRAFVRLTDGTRLFTGYFLVLQHSGDLMLVFDGALPPREADLWVTAIQTEAIEGHGGPAATGRLGGFMTGTCIATPEGPVPIETLEIQSWVLTRDRGPQRITWIGHRHLSGARLAALPAMAPVRIRSGFMGDSPPQPDLILGPDHHVMVAGPTARLLYGAGEVLVAARDLVDARHVARVHRLRACNLYALVLQSRQIIFANGMACESQDPAELAPRAMAGQPDIVCAPAFPARRILSRAEAALYRHGAFGSH